MLLNLLKRALKNALHQATEEWLLETGLPKEMIDDLRAQREQFVLQSVAHADALAARRLDVDDEQDAASEVPALPMPGMVPGSQPNGADESGELMDLVHQQRQANVSWAEIAQAASQKGFQGTEEALRQRYKRWRKKNGLIEETDQAG